MEFLLPIAVILAALSAPLTIFVLFRWGLVGGTPRELMAVQFEIEAKRVAVEDRRLALEEEKLKLVREQANVKAELIREQARGTRQTFNPQEGMRGAPLPPPPPPRIPLPPQRGR